LETEKFYLKDSELLNWLKLIDANVPVYAQEAKITLSYTFDEKPYQNVITLKKDENEKFPYAEESGDFATLRDINTKNGIQRHLSSLTIALPQGFGQNISAKFEDRIYPNAIQLLNIIKDTSPNRLALAKWIELYDFKHKEKGTPTSNWSEAIRHLFEIISKITLSEDEDGKEIGKVEFLKTAKTDSGNTRILVKTPDNTGGIDLNLLSQGYQNLFYWVGSLLSALYRFKDYATEEAEYEEYGKADVKNLPAVVIIDEIDTYLNADWQANILRVLYEEFPNIQFIVTTHSDLVLSGFDNEKIHIITPNEVFSPRNNTYGLDRTRVSVFTGTQIRFPKIQKWIEEADNFIENNDFSAAEAKIRELKNANPLISDILRLEAQIRNRKS
jgi:hypothetical protein